MRKKLLSLGLALLALAGCADLQINLRDMPKAGPPTEAEIIAGLKEALTLGARKGAEKLAARDGYYGDSLVRIPLPDEARVIADNIGRVPGGKKLLEDLIVSINRAAEDAAREAAPVFAASIQKMTVSDGLGILHGPDDAATSYLRKTTHDGLYSLYRPKIAASTDKKLVAGVSARETWVSLTGKWNTLAGSAAGRIAGFSPVNTDLDDFLTRKALDGIYLKLAGEELKIRKEISARVTPLLRKVFALLDGKRG